MDNIAAGVISVEQKIERKYSKDFQPSLFGDKSRTYISEVSKRSMKSSKVTPIQAKQLTT